MVLMNLMVLAMESTVLLITLRAAVKRKYYDNDSNFDADNNATSLLFYPFSYQILKDWTPVEWIALLICLFIY